MKAPATVVAAVLFATAALAEGPDNGFDRELYDRFVSMRMGDGDPVYWYSVGTLKSYPDGELLFRMEGFDTARRLESDDAPDRATQLSRKIYIYRDAQTNAVLRSYDGQPVEPIAYPYQLISYDFKGAYMETWVEQGRGPFLQKIGPGTDILARRVGDSVIFSAPLFLDLETPAGPLQAFENYDFVIQPEGAVSVPNQLSWVRYGDGPEFAGAPKTIFHLVSWRVDRFEDLPETIRAYIETDAPLWQRPPESLDEIRALQQAED